MLHLSQTSFHCNMTPKRQLLRNCESTLTSYTTTYTPQTTSTSFRHHLVILVCSIYIFILVRLGIKVQLYQNDYLVDRLGRYIFIFVVHGVQFTTNRCIGFYCSRYNRFTYVRKEENCCTRIVYSGPLWQWLQWSAVVVALRGFCCSGDYSGCYRGGIVQTVNMLEDKIKQ